MKYKETYEWGKDKLKQAGILDAALDARILLEYVCGTNRTTLYAHLQREVSEQESLSYAFFIQRRAEHVPLQYITGTQSFMGLDFFVNESVLIPRQDTEILVEEVMLHLHDKMALLDLCTGSGCILLSLLKYSNDCTGLGIDISDAALMVARKNAERLGITCKTDTERLFQKSDLFETVEGRFDIIVSNPPYIRTRVIDTLMPEVKEHEPVLALDGMEDGLYFYRKIIDRAPDYLYRGGMLFFEIGYDQAEEVKKRMEDRGFHEVSIKKDYAGLDRVVYGTYYEGEEKNV